MKPKILISKLDNWSIIPYANLPDVHTHMKLLSKIITCTIRQHVENIIHYDHVNSILGI